MGAQKPVTNSTIQVILYRYLCLNPSARVLEAIHLAVTIIDQVLSQIRNRRKEEIALESE